MSKDIAANKMEEGTTVGFIGCGTIAVAIATGLLKQSEVPISCVYVSKRSESRSAALLSNFPDNVIVSDENQEIVDACSVLFLCVLPQQEEEVLNELEMKDDTILVSLVSTSKVQTLIENSRLPPERVHKMICLPAVAQLEGTPLLVPPSKSNIHELLSVLGGGTCIQCESESAMEAMMVSTAMMGPIYGLMKRNRDFLIKEGVPPKDASKVVGRQYFAMVKDAMIRGDDENSLESLIEEQTPGGLNEQTLNNLESMGVLNRYEDAMQAVLQRIRGESDGSIPTK